MKSRVDSRMRQEARTFQLRFACPDCAHFEPIQGRCAEGFPNAEHLSPELERDSVVFCKLFEGA